MSDKNFTIILNQTTVRIEAEEEGRARYMVRMVKNGESGATRIGYLTGANQTWLAEPYSGTKQSFTATSAKEACTILAKMANSIQA
ncbi:hypothetical protein [Undibacterium oligocarboniphilum]|uniref:Uncharacterized protein n=1 Tax=Undibacterium oligocarboniphilum TaxID=666702 RepID=A0A850QPX5_9BURK|nr:hypothetical protein [Undibacterium oligocarboniphilum]MBC3871747.1 hypothetical protein [Undibacterium oligocarboniphilum]NVO79383.1 hypothetical protein [Undibacterium oligocarboniphilum]